MDISNKENESKQDVELLEKATSEFEYNDLLLPNPPNCDYSKEDWVDRQVRIFWRNKEIDGVLNSGD